MLKGGHPSDLCHLPWVERNLPSKWSFLRSNRKNMVNSQYTWSIRKCPQNTDHILKKHIHIAHITTYAYNTDVSRLLIAYMVHRSYHSIALICFNDVSNFAIKTLQYNFHSNACWVNACPDKGQLQVVYPHCFLACVPASMGQCVRVTRTWLKYKSSGWKGHANLICTNISNAIQLMDEIRLISWYGKHPKLCRIPSINSTTYNNNNNNTNTNTNTNANTNTNNNNTNNNNNNNNNNILIQMHMQYSSRTYVQHVTHPRLRFQDYHALSRMISGHSPAFKTLFHPFPSKNPSTSGFCRTFM